MKNVLYLTKGLLSWRQEHIAKLDIRFFCCLQVSGGDDKGGSWSSYSPVICYQQTIVLGQIIGGIKHFFVIWTSLFLDSFVRKWFNIILDAL